MGKINLLDDRIINQIAAGEVVENPASVIKELVENSIDAGATSITVEFAKGGTELIRIIDNGSGMDDVDAKTAFIRHATSKISSAEDLEHISTMGFRGEALASISEVSRTQLTTSTGDVGTRITVNGGVVGDIRPIGFPRGTTIEVGDLFFNTPARKKFLRSTRSETTSILELCQKFVLAHPEISFKVINGGRVELQSSRDKTPLGAIATVFGESSRDELYAVEYEAEGISIKGYTSKPQFSQLNRRKQVFFVNGRYIKSPMIASALEEAYKGSIMINKYPWAVLFIELPYDMVDVNVHPQKTEVRFANSRQVYDSVIRAVSRVLTPTSVINEVKLTDEEIKPVKAPEVAITLSDRFDDEPVPIEPKVSTAAEPKTVVVQPPAEPKARPMEAEPVITKSSVTEKPVTPTPVKPAEAEHIKATPVEVELPKKDEKKDTVATSVRERVGGFDYNTMPRVEHSAPTKEAPQQINVFTPEEEGLQLTDYKLCGVLWDTYILCESGDKCYIIDQHAAHERFLYDRYSEEFRQKRVLVQQLLIPDVIEAEPFVIDLISENKELFEELGFEIDVFGKSSCIIRGVPSVACEVPFKAVFDEAVERIKQNTSANTIVKDIVCNELIKSACKHAVKGNQKLSDKEIRYIIDAVGKLNALTCPHGRPIAVILTKKEMEKKFGRIQ